jgi:hypothetical protein
MTDLTVNLETLEVIPTAELAEFSHYEYGPHQAFDVNYAAAVEVKTVNDANGHPYQVAELEQFYHRNGYFRLECSDEFPEELMAQALTAAFKVIEAEANKQLG